MELLYRFEGRIGASTPVGLLGEGLRLDNAFEGRITDGILAGGRAWGTDYVRLRDDGVWVLDAREVIEVPGGRVHASARGYGLPPTDSPPPTSRRRCAPDTRPRTPASRSGSRRSARRAPRVSAG
jgi:hypothetical protein